MDARSTPYAAAFNAANPRSRSALRSSTFSRPIRSRCHSVTQSWLSRSPRSAEHGRMAVDYLVAARACVSVIQDVMPQPQPDRENTAGRRVGAGSVNNKIQKTAVNPLTRHASRSVMGTTISRRKLRGLPRYPIHCLTELHIKLQVGVTLFSEGSAGWPNDVRRCLKNDLRTTSLKGLAHETRISGCYPRPCRRSLGPGRLGANPQDRQGPRHAVLRRQPGPAGLLDPGRQG